MTSNPFSTKISDYAWKSRDKMTLWVRESSGRSEKGDICGTGPIILIIFPPSGGLPLNGIWLRDESLVLNNVAEANFIMCPVHLIDPIQVHLMIKSKLRSYVQITARVLLSELIKNVTRLGDFYEVLLHCEMDLSGDLDWLFMLCKLFD